MDIKKTLRIFHFIAFNAVMSLLFMTQTSFSDLSPASKMREFNCKKVTKQKFPDQYEVLRFLGNQLNAYKTELASNHSLNKADLCPKLVRSLTGFQHRIYIPNYDQEFIYGLAINESKSDPSCKNILSYIEDILSQYNQYVQRCVTHIEKGEGKFSEVLHLFEAITAEEKPDVSPHPIVVTRDIRSNRSQESVYLLQYNCKQTIYVKNQSHNEILNFLRSSQEYYHQHLKDKGSISEQCSQFKKGIEDFTYFGQDSEMGTPTLFKIAYSPQQPDPKCKNLELEIDKANQKLTALTEVCVKNPTAFNQLENKELNLFQNAKPSQPSSSLLTVKKFKESTLPLRRALQSPLPKSDLLDPLKEYFKKFF